MRDSEVRRAKKIAKSKTVQWRAATCKEMTRHGVDGRGDLWVTDGAVMALKRKLSPRRQKWVDLAHHIDIPTELIEKILEPRRDLQVFTFSGRLVDVPGEPERVGMIYTSRDNAAVIDMELSPPETLYAVVSEGKVGPMKDGLDRCTYVVMPLKEGIYEL